MAVTTNSTIKAQWTNTQAISLAVVSLMVGTCSGFLLRRSQSQADARTIGASPAPTGTPTAAAKPLHAAFDIQVGAKLERLRSDPNNPGILIELGNLYYDSRQYAAAIEYYQRVLARQPANTDVRTDLGTAYWYIGDADSAISEFNKSLSYQPTKPDTLYNLGIVQLRGKRDSAAAITTWQKLLAENPQYEQKDKIQKLVADAQASH